MLITVIVLLIWCLMLTLVGCLLFMVDLIVDCLFAYLVGVVLVCFWFVCLLYILGGCFVLGLVFGFGIAACGFVI